MTIGCTIMVGSVFIVCKNYRPSLFSANGAADSSPVGPSAPSVAVAPAASGCAEEAFFRRGAGGRSELSAKLALCTFAVSFLVVEE